MWNKRQIVTYLVVTVISLSSIITTFTSQAKAGLIIQDQFSSSVSAGWASILGQSFTAEDSNVKIAPYFWQTSSTDLTISLYGGTIQNGTLPPLTSLASVQTTIPAFVGAGNTPVGEWYELDFSSVTLNIGSVYTFTIDDTFDNSAFGTHFTNSR